jgi:hypothetical protein
VGPLAGVSKDEGRRLLERGAETLDARIYFNATLQSCTSAGVAVPAFSVQFEK